MLLAACGGSSDEQALRDRVEQLEAALGSSSLSAENPSTTDAPTTTVATTTTTSTTTTIAPTTTTTVVPTTTNVSSDEEFWEAACTGVQAALNGWMKGNDANRKANEDVPGYDRDLRDYLFGEAAWTAERHADLWGPRALHSTRSIQQQYQTNMLILADAFTLIERNRLYELDEEALNAAWVDLQSACRWHDFYPVPCPNNLDLPLFKGSWFDYQNLVTECYEDS